ncbi:MAG: ABC transporter substrate-binding protein [Lachnospiraceae bacterium]
MKKKILSVLLTLAMVAGLTACGGGENQTVTTPQTNGSASDSTTAFVETSGPKEGGVLKVALSTNPPSLDSMLYTAAAVRDANRVMFEGLFELDANYNPSPQLAESYEVDEEYKKWVFHLRKGVLFHDGTEMKAEDVVASMNRWLEYNKTMSTIIKNGEQFYAVDDYTVEIDLEETGYLLLNMMTAPARYPYITTVEAIESCDKETGALTEYIGTGPLKFVEWVQDSYIKYEKFEDYVGPGYELTGEAGDKNVYYDEVYYYIVTDSSVRAAAIQTGEYDVVQSVSYDDIAMLDANSDVTLAKNTVGNYGILINKAEGSKLNEQLVRQAFCYAVDVDEIMAVVISEPDYIETYSSMMPKNTDWYTESGSEYWSQHDSAKAAQLLAEAGYDGTPIRILTTPDYPTWVDGCQILKDQLEAAGFTVEVDSMDWATVQQTKKEKDAWEAIIQWWPAVPVPTALRCNSTTDNGWMAFEDVIALLESINSSTSFEKAYELWDEANKKLLEYGSFVPLGYADEAYAVYKSVNNYSPFLGMNVYNCYPTE